jgi:hypothetical protein
MIFTRDIYVLGTWNLYPEPVGGLPVFTELPRRVVFSETELPVYDILGNWASVVEGA